MNDQIDSAIPTPDARVHSLLNLGTQTGTIIGEAVRMAMQFKSFPMTVLRKGLAPLVYGRGADSFQEALFKGKADYLGIVHLLVATTVFGYLAMVARDTFRGRTPRDPSDPKVIAAAMAQGGGLGIYGDFIFGEFNRVGQSALATALGPTIGQLEGVMRMYADAKDGNPVAMQAYRLVINNTPFVNIFYTRAALDYLFLFELQESINPGFLNRMEQRMLREHNQTFYVPPSEVIPFGGR